VVFGRNCPDLVFNYDLEYGNVVEFKIHVFILKRSTRTTTVPLGYTLALTSYRRRPTKLCVGAERAHK
jgi:hypothetical protein